MIPRHGSTKLSIYFILQENDSWLASVYCYITKIGEIARSFSELQSFCMNSHLASPLRDDAGRGSQAGGIRWTTK